MLRNTSSSTPLEMITSVPIVGVKVEIHLATNNNGSDTRDCGRSPLISGGTGAVVTKRRARGPGMIGFRGARIQELQE